MQDNPQWWVVAVAGTVQTSMDLGAGMVDVLRFGEGMAAALVLPRCNTQAMQWHLDEISSKVSPRAQRRVILFFCPIRASSCHLDRQTLPDWVQRFNAAGAAGLLDRKVGFPANLRLHRANVFKPVFNSSSDEKR